MAAWQPVPSESGASLVMLRSFIEKTHELAVHGEPEEASSVLHEAAQLAASWS